MVVPDRRAEPTIGIGMNTERNIEANECPKEFERYLAYLQIVCPSASLGMLEEVLQHAEGDVTKAAWELRFTFGFPINEDDNLLEMMRRFSHTCVDTLHNVLVAQGQSVDVATRVIRAGIKPPQELRSFDVSANDFETLARMVEVEEDLYDDADQVMKEDECVYNSDGEEENFEDSLEGTGDETPVIPDLPQASDTFEAQYYRNLDISSDEVEAHQTQFKKDLLVALRAIVAGAKRMTWETIMSGELMENAVFPEVRTMLGGRYYSRAYFLELRPVTSRHCRKGVYGDRITDPDNECDDVI
ncbi:hypothetical protein N8T08_001756 [Aspergillus melleus]|uniref:Uncharacterized protein n=1 Tax=Aspergillus melleus TaxID=138277 RepID=A0ACC3AMZ4_9EURO|nr:hypothetical protein N8T08_001756 [Aspergillus melleus]